VVLFIPIEVGVNVIGPAVPTWALSVLIVAFEKVAMPLGATAVGCPL
jgi:hypothetical protein